MQFVLFINHGNPDLHIPVGSGLPSCLHTEADRDSAARKHLRPCLVHLQYRLLDVGVDLPWN